MNYEKLINHLNKDCRQISSPCPDDCGELVTLNNWEQHFENCTLAEMRCPQCEKIFKKQNIKLHNCVSEVMYQMKIINQRIDGLNHQISNQSQQI